MSRKNCVYESRRMQPGTIVLVLQLATNVVPPRPGVLDLWHNHVLVPLVVLVLVESSLGQRGVGAFALWGMSHSDVVDWTPLPWTQHFRKWCCTRSTLARVPVSLP